MISMVFILLARICGAVEAILLVYCVLTWFMSRTSRVMQFLSGMLEPLLMPIRGFLFRFTGQFGLDFSPLILMILLQAVQSLFIRLAYTL